MRLLFLLICCPLLAAAFPFVTDLFYTGHEMEQHPLVQALIHFGGPFVLAFLAAALIQPLSSFQSQACFVVVCGFAFGIGYTVSMNHVRRDGPGNLAPIEVVLMTAVATASLGAGASVGTLASMALKR
jgi:hypothetical protein